MPARTIAVPLLLACAVAGPGLHGPVTAAAQEREAAPPEREPGAPQGISVFVDGVRVNEPTVEEINFDLLPLDDVERLELIRGPGAVFGRNTLGGVLNIITKRGAEVREIVPEAEWGSFGRQKYRFRLGGVEGPADYYVAGTFFSEDGWRDASASRVGRLFTRVGLRAGR